MENDHPFPLADFVEGRLSETDNLAVIEHLASCESCEAEVERLWRRSEPGRALPQVPDAQAVSTDRVESSLFRRIRRTDLGGQVIQLSTQGFLDLIVALVRPFMGGVRSSRSKER